MAGSDFNIPVTSLLTRVRSLVSFGTPPRMLEVKATVFEVAEYMSIGIDTGTAL